MIIVLVIGAIALLVVAGRLDARWRDYLDSKINAFRRRGK